MITLEPCPSIAILGTDTGVGKTVFTGKLAKHWQQFGSVITQKWVQTGCTAGVPEDIAAHNAAMGQNPVIDDAHWPWICPYQFALPASPHLAAQKEGQTIDITRIIAAHHQLVEHYDHVICEGAGGLMVPITEDVLLLDVVARLRLPVILVIDNKLGCINHSLLSLAALRQRHLTVLGVVFNRIDPEQNPVILDDNERIICALGETQAIVV